MKFNRVLKVYADLDKNQPCAIPFYGKDSVSTMIRQVQYEVRSMKNRAMRMCYDYDCEQYEYFKYIQKCKEETGREDFPSAEPSDFSKYKTFDGFLYDVLAKEYPTMGKSTAATITRKVWSEYKNDKKEIMRGKKSLKTYSEGQPIPIPAAVAKLTFENDFDFVLTISAFSKEAAKSMGMKIGGLRFVLRENTDSECAILKRILSGEYRMGEVLLAYDDKKNHKTKIPRGWYFCINFSFEKDTSNPELDVDKILGVDIGLANVLYLGWSKDDHFKKYIPGSEIRKFQSTMERRKRDMLRCGPARGDGSKGHGRKCATKRVDAFEHHIHNFKETKNWNYAHFVIDAAVKGGFGTIQMENLAGITKSEKFDRSWTFYSLQNKIEQLAAENGIEVRYIEPKFTSQMCSRCGHISHDNRKTQSDFRCVACGYRRNADHNAAMNISKANEAAKPPKELYHVPDLPGEEWRDVKGFEGQYAVSNMGRVKSLHRDLPHAEHGTWHISERLLKQGMTGRWNGGQYYGVSFHLGHGKMKMQKVHRLVAEAFIPRIEGKNVVNHKDCNKLNNCVDNLEWCTDLENVHHAMVNDRMDWSKTKRTKVQNVETGEVFDTIIAAEKKYNAAKGAIGHACRKGYKSCGYHWRYI